MRKRKRSKKPATPEESEKLREERRMIKEAVQRERDALTRQQGKP